MQIGTHNIWWERKLAHLFFLRQFGNTLILYPHFILDFTILLLESFPIDTLAQVCTGVCTGLLTVALFIIVTLETI